MRSIFADRWLYVLSLGLVLLFPSCRENNAPEYEPFWGVIEETFILTLTDERGDNLLEDLASLKNLSVTGVESGKPLASAIRTSKNGQCRLLVRAEVPNSKKYEGKSVPNGTILQSDIVIEYKGSSLPLSCTFVYHGTNQPDMCMDPLIQLVQMKWEDVVFTAKNSPDGLIHLNLRFSKGKLTVKH